MHNARRSSIPSRAPPQVLAMAGKRWVLFILVWMLIPIRTLGYNPLSCSNADRWHDIVTETANFDIVLLNGTGMRYDEHYSSFHVNDHLVVSSGFRNSTFSNKSCGCALIFGKRLRNAKFHPPIEASIRIPAGRWPTGLTRLSALLPGLQRQFCTVMSTMGLD